MDLTTIYKDDNIIVEIPNLLALTLENLINTYFKLSPLETENFLDRLLAVYRDIIPLKEYKIITTSQVPYLSRGGIFDLKDPYRDMADAILLVSDYFDTTTGCLSNIERNELSTLVHLYYKTQFRKDCYLHFFDEDVNRVSGAFIFLSDGKMLILPFNLNEADNYYTLS